MNQKAQSPKHSAQIFSSLFEIYKSQFIDYSEDILNKKESDLLNFFFNKMNLKIVAEFNEHISNDHKYLKSMKECEKKIYQFIYKPMYTMCQNAFNNYVHYNSKQHSTKQKDSIYLVNFRPHCCYNQIPIHTCKGRFILVYDPNFSSKPLYVICVNCKKCYFESSILMLCINCKKPFYSSIISSCDKQLPPATWEKYHCNIIRNEQMDCINCKDKFWLKNSNLYCKSCKTLVSPLEIEWQCVKCHKLFKTGAKPYNPLEFKIIKIAKENALLYKRECKPKETPCKCFQNENIDLYKFYHSSKCKGIMYFGKSIDKDIVICSLCNKVTTLNKFNWECPICKITFIMEKIKVYSNDKDSNNDKSAIIVENDNNIIRNKINVRLHYNSAIFSHNPNDMKISNLKESNIGKRVNKIKNIHTLLFEQSEPNISSITTKRNFSINLINNKMTKHRKILSYVSNYDYEENDNGEDFIQQLADSSSNGKLKIHLVRHPNKKGMLFNKKAEKKHPKPQIATLNTQRCCTSENYLLENGEQKRIINLGLSSKGSSSNIKEANSKEKPKSQNTHAFIPKMTISLSDNKNCNVNKNSNVPMSSGTKNLKEKKGQNRFRVDYESPLKEKGNPQIILFNSDEKEQKDKLMKNKKIQINKNINKNKRIHRELSGGNDKFDYHNDEIEIKSIITNKKDDNSNLKKYNSKTTPILVNTSSSRSIHGMSTISSAKSSSDKLNIVSLNRESFKENVILAPFVPVSTPQTDEELKEFDANDYSIITQLGQGAFGKIYLVQDQNLNIFSMKKIILNEELDISGIIKEYRLAHRLKHPNIIEIIGLYTTKLDLTTYGIYILMEVGLTDWEKEIKSNKDKQKFYSEQELCNILKQLILALAFLQSENVSHRDIKPQNVLVFKNNIYKLADFGEAKEITSTGNKQISTLRGTELYMSPLLFNGLKTNQLDIKHNIYKSDVYSLGLCFVFAATLTTNTINEIRKIVEMKNVRVFLTLTLSQLYSQHFIDLISDMLEINEGNRPDFLELKQRI